MTLLLASMRFRVFSGKTPGHIHSSDLDVISEPELRRRRVAAIQKRERDAEHHIWQAIVARFKASMHEAAAQRLEREERTRNRRRINAEVILRTVCAWYDQPRLDLISHRKPKPLARARQIAIYLMRHHTLLSTAEIGRRFGGRDHSTVIFAVQAMQAKLDAGDRNLKREIAQLRHVLGVSDGNPEYSVPACVSDQPKRAEG